MNPMRQMGPVSAICVGILLVAWYADIEPLWIVFGVLGFLAYLAFAGTQAYKKKPNEQKRAWYMD